MTNPHRSRNHASPEHRESMKKIHLQIEKQNRLNKLRGALQKNAIEAYAAGGPEDIKRQQAENRRFQTSESFDPQTAEIFRKKDKNIGGNNRDLLGEQNLIPRVLIQRDDRKRGGPQSDLIDDVNLVRDDLKETKNLAIDRALARGMSNKGHKIRPPKPNTFDRVRSMKAQLQKIAVNFSGGSFGPDFDAIEAFKAKKPYASKKFETDGKVLKLNGHVVARHHKKGIEVSNAGFDTNKTYNTIKGLGIHARRQGGKTVLGDKEIDVNSGEFVLVPHKKISDKPIKYTSQPRRNTNRTVSEQTSFNKAVANKGEDAAGRPLSTVNIQPQDQRIINAVTGINSPIGKPIRATEAHHIFPVKKMPGLKNNPNNGIMMPSRDHRELHRLNAKLATLKTPKDTSNDMQTSEYLSADSIVDSFIKSKNNIEGTSGVFDPIKGTILNAKVPADAIRLQKLFGGERLGFNSITDTRQGPATDIELIRKQLKEIEQNGGKPALGFDNGSLEAVDVSIGSDEDIMSKLLDHQNSTGILDENLTFRILDNPKYKLE